MPRDDINEIIMCILYQDKPHKFTTWLVGRVFKWEDKLLLEDFGEKK